MHVALLWGAVVFYGLGIALVFPAALRGRPSLSQAALAVLGAGLLAHAAGIATLAVQTRHFPVTDLRSALSFFAFLITLTFFLAYLRYRIHLLGIFMLPLAFLLTLIAVLEPGRTLLSPAFRGSWLVVHIGCVLLGYAGFSLTAVAAVLYLIQENELKSKKPRAIYYRLPSLEVCDELSHRSLLFGFTLLTIGIVSGFIWASRMWQGPWELDPKILAALVTWLVYLFLLSARLSGYLRGRRSAYVALFGFALMMVTFVGISFLSGFHGYFPNAGAPH
jgi:cytochrome c-type biogenesis protein CcsB